jgi:chemotaxis protein CheC
MRISAERRDALAELVNIGVGRAAGILNEILATPIRLSVPEVRLFGPGEEAAILALLSPNRVSAVRIGFGGSFVGSASLVFPPESAASLVALLTGEAEAEEEDLDSIRVGTLSEVGNIVLNGVMGSVTNVLGERLEYDLPEYLEGEPSRLVERGPIECLLLATTRFEAAGAEIAGEILLLFASGTLDRLLQSVDRALQGERCSPPA